MTKLHRLFAEQGQSAWLDNLTRTSLHDRTLARFVDDGIRGVTANPTIFAKAIEGSDAYDDQFATLISGGRSIVDAYWDLVIDDVRHALAVLRPVFDASGGLDGFVSIEVAPELARDTAGTICAARDLHTRIDRPNVLVKIPATSEGIPAIQAMTAEGRSINITLIFSLQRYAAVIDAYLSGLEQYASAGGDLAGVHSVASFFVSRVDSEVDRRLETIATPDALGLRGRAAVAQAKLAYQLFCDRFSDQRWGALETRGARLQRPCGHRRQQRTRHTPKRCTSTISSARTPSTPSPKPLSQHSRTTAPSPARLTLTSTTHRQYSTGSPVSVSDLADVGRTLEDQGVAGFHDSFTHVLETLTTKARHLTAR